MGIKAKPSPPPSVLPPKLEAVLARAAIGCKLNKTRAAKLPYLVDVVANHVLGRPITEGTHQTWERGVVTAEAWRCFDRGGNENFEVEPVPFSEEKVVKFVGGEPPDALSEEETAVVDAVLEEFGGTWAADLGKITKHMNPWVPSWGANRHADVSEDAYDRLSSEYQSMVERAAKWTLDRLRRESVVVLSGEEAIAGDSAVAYVGSR